MEKITVNYYTQEVTGLEQPQEHLCSAEVSYVPQIGSKVFLKEDEYDFNEKRPTDGYKIDGLYVVKEIHQVIHNKFEYFDEELEGNKYRLPGWKTKESLEIMVTPLKTYLK